MPRLCLLRRVIGAASATNRRHGCRGGGCVARPIAGRVVTGVFRALDRVTQLAADAWSFAYYALDGLRPDALSTSSESRNVARLGGEPTTPEEHR